MMQRFLRAIDGALQRVGVIRNAVSVRAETRGRQVNSVGIAGPFRVDRLRRDDAAERDEKRKSCETKWDQYRASYNETKWFVSLV